MTHWLTVYHWYKRKASSSDYKTDKTTFSLRLHTIVYQTDMQKGEKHSIVRSHSRSKINLSLSKHTFTLTSWNWRAGTDHKSAHKESLITLESSANLQHHLKHFKQALNFSIQWRVFKKHPYSASEHGTWKEEQRAFNKMADQSLEVCYIKQLKSFNHLFSSIYTSASVS